MDANDPRVTEAEKAVLGSVMIDNAALEDAAFLGSEHFYNPRYGLVWSAMWRLYQAHQAIDELTLRGELSGTDITVAEINSMVQTTASAVNVSSYANDVLEAATRRGLLLASSEVARAAHADLRPIGDCLETSIAAIEAVMEGHVSGRDTTRAARDVAGDVLIDALRWREDPSLVRGVASGLAPVDEMLGGFQPSELTSIAGRPGQGKSALLGRLAWGIAAKKQPVIFFSLEMTASAMVRRMGCQIAHVSSTMLKAGKLHPDEFKLFQDAIEDVATYPLWIEARSGLTVREMQAIARRYERKHGLAVVMIDTLNRVSSDGKSPYERMTNASHATADWAHNSRYSIIQAVQMSRVNENTSDKRPTLAALRDSGAIEEDNDNILGLYRPHYYDRDNRELEHVAELRILKFRDGDSDAQADLYWRSDCLSFDQGEHNVVDSGAPLEIGGTHAAYAAGRNGGR